MRRKSSVMIGRDACLKSLVHHYERLDADRPRFLLIRGEAGIGKSRLLGEFLDIAERREGILLQGDCLSLRLFGGPFAPLIQALRHPVVRSGTAHRRARITQDLRTLTEALSSLGAPAPAASRPSAAQIAEQVLSTLARISHDAPVVLAIEDIHWADAATRELIQFLHHNLQRARVLLVLTDRTDEPSPQPTHLHLVAELVRAGAEIIELESLEADDIRLLLTSRGGGEVADDVAREIHRRSGGNPLYCELLQDAWSTGEILPNTLKDLLLARTSRVSARARTLLELLAVVGHPASEGMLAALWEGGALGPALREAVAAKLLASRDGGYRFRHSLISEALLDELLPGDLARLHRRVAETLTTRSALADDTGHLFALRIANHWYAAGEKATALRTAVHAALLIDVSSPADALRLYERALNLSGHLREWPVPSTCRAEVLRRAAESAFSSGDVVKARTLVHQALGEIAAGRPGAPSRALLYEHLGRYLEGSNGQDSGQECRECYERALSELAASDSPRTWARVLCSCGLSRVTTGCAADGMGLLSRARTIAARSEDPHLQAIVDMNLAEATSCVRELETSIKYARNARDAAFRIDCADVALRTYFVEARAAYLVSGRLADSIRIRWEGLRFADRHGQAYSGGTMLRLALVEDLIEAGGWGEAAGLTLDRLPSNPKSILETEEHLVSCFLAAHRGHPVARERVPELQRLLPVDNLVHETYFLSLLVPIASALGHQQALEELSDRVLELAAHPLPSLGGGLFLVHALAAVIEAHGDRADGEGGCGHGVPRLLDVAEETYTRARTSVVAEVELTDGVIEVARAQAERHRGVHRAEHWSRACEVFRRTGARARLAPALLGQGRALLTQHAEHRRAHRLLEAAHGLAAKMGAEPLCRRIADVAERAAPGQGETAPHPADLTPRQAEVLRLIAHGRTDREIAEELTISTRTANSHVAHILERLGARNRSEAALRYHQTHQAAPEPGTRAVDA
ncbi:helix-turn-helix transcriptional regulator [Streptomyces sp. MNP-20]|uniref:helix-turn-helix transcriptional regulator n=1 Tax=Streptomyces sp. MNP-20 TaxID=2721165 RepID=UPI0015576D2E|nr:AAA family ATPase [Streptomyces sp. MNP-20]